jgi:hypothetical protein
MPPNSAPGEAIPSGSRRATASLAVRNPVVYVLTPTSIVVYAPPYAVPKTLLRPVDGGFAVGQNVFVEGKKVVNEYAGGNLSHLATISMPFTRKLQPSRHLEVAPNGTLIVGLQTGLMFFVPPYDKAPRQIETASAGNVFQPKNLTMGTNGRFYFTGADATQPNRPCALYFMDPPYATIRKALDRACDPKPPVHDYFAIDATNANQYAGVRAYAPPYTGAPDWRSNGFKVNVLSPTRLVANANVAAYQSNNGEGAPWYVFSPPAAAPVATLYAPHIDNDADWPIAIGDNAKIYTWDPASAVVDVYAFPYGSVTTTIGRQLTNVSGLVVH